MNSRPCLSLPLASGSRVLVASLLAGLAALGATAQQVYTSGGVNVTSYSGPPAPPPPPPPETYSSGPSLGPEWSRPMSNDFMPGSSSNYGSRQYPRRNIRQSFGPFFLPTLLPVLGAARPASPEPLAANYPREFAGEPFFMAYGNLAANNQLSAKRVDRIARYQAARRALLTELREQLNRGPDALAHLAAAQTPRLLELESEAELIRHDLTHVQLFKTTADDIGKLVPTKGNANYAGLSFTSVPLEAGNQVLTREDPRFSADLTALRQHLSAAHFRDGFSPDQRRLLEEMAQEIVLTIEPEPAGTNPAPVFFWPAGARIPAPTGLAPEVAARFDEFQRRKAALKDELRTALTREQKRLLNIDRTEAYAQLAAAQAPRFAELDTLAGQLRPALAALADTRATPAPELPADLVRQVGTMVERKTALQRELYAGLTAFRLELPAERLELKRGPGGLAITIVTDEDSSNRTAVGARITTFNAEIAARYTALAAERDAVRDALARYQANTPGAKPGATVDQLAADFLAAYNGQEARSRQSEYAAAVLAPDLSPAQRRLLLTATASSMPDSPAFVAEPVSSLATASSR